MKKRDLVLELLLSLLAKVGLEYLFLAGGLLRFEASFVCGLIKIYCLFALLSGSSRS